MMFGYLQIAIQSIVFLSVLILTSLLLSAANESATNEDNNSDSDYENKFYVDDMKATVTNLSYFIFSLAKCVYIPLVGYVYREVGKYQKDGKFPFKQGSKHTSTHTH